MSLNKSAYAILAVLFVASMSLAQGPSKLRNEQPPLPTDQIIRKFAEKEQQFKIARANYTYRQDVRVQTLNGNDGVTGEFRLVSDIVFDSSGRRGEKIINAPPDSLKNISMSPEDMEDLRNIQPFALSTDDVGKYNLKYLGKEMVDEIDCYVFDVAPRTIEKKQRYFQGQIWVDDKDLQIVKTYGKAVPDIHSGTENLFPRFETYREQIDGEFWFPTYTRAVDTLRFTGYSQKIRMTVKYESYKKFKADVKLTFGDAVEGDGAKGAGTTENSTKAPALDPSLKQSTTPKKK